MPLHLTGAHGGLLTEMFEVARRAHEPTAFPNAARVSC